MGIWIIKISNLLPITKFPHFFHQVHPSLQKNLYFFFAKFVFLLRLFFQKHFFLWKLFFQIFFLKIKKKKFLKNYFWRDEIDVKWKEKFGGKEQLAVDQLILIIDKKINNIKLDIVNFSNFWIDNQNQNHNQNLIW